VHKRIRHLLWPLSLAAVASFGLRTISTPEIWTRLALGRSIITRGLPLTDPLSFSAAGQTWIDVQWLYDLLMYFTWNAGGAAGVIGIHTGAVIAACLLLLPLALRNGGGCAAGWALLLCGWMLGPVFQPSSAVFSLIFPAAFLLVLERPRPLWICIALLAPLQVLWTNIHPGFLLGPTIVLLAGLESRFQESAPAPHAPRPTLLLAATLVVATLLNPYGPRLHLHVVSTMLFNPGANYISEWISPFSMFGHPLYTVYPLRLALLVGAGALILHKSRLPITLTALAILAALLAVLRPTAHQALFAIAGFPVLALGLRALGESIHSRFSSIREPSRRWGGLGSMAGGGAAIATLFLVLSGAYTQRSGSLSRPGLGVEFDIFPEAAVSVLRHPDFPARTVNLWRDGGYLAWAYPDRKIFVDERYDLYGARFYQRIAADLTGQPEELDRFERLVQPDAFIINCCLPGATRSIPEWLTSGRWGLIYFDGTTAILVRLTQAHAGLLNNPELQAAGSQVLARASEEFAARMQGGSGVPFSPRLIGAATFLAEIKRHDEALSFYALLASGRPDVAAYWRGLGLCLIESGRLDEALTKLEEAVSRHDRDAWLWMLLSRVHALRDEAENARQAYRRAARLDPALAAQFGDPMAPPSDKRPPLTGPFTPP
jgi:hypothetical protein